MSQSSSMIHPRVGVAVFVFDKQGNFILGERKGSNGAGTLGHPGGHLELFEEFEECARRETLEETGLELKNVKFITAANSIFDGKDGTKVHYVTIWMGAQRADESIEPVIMEPTKCASWNWTSWSQVVDWASHDFVPTTNSEVIVDTDATGGKAPKIFKPIVNLAQIMSKSWSPYEAYQAVLRP